MEATDGQCRDGSPHKDVRRHDQAPTPQRPYGRGTRGRRWLRRWRLRKRAPHLSAARLERWIAELSEPAVTPTPTMTPRNVRLAHLDPLATMSAGGQHHGLIIAYRKARRKPPKYRCTPWPPATQPATPSPATLPNGSADPSQSLSEQHHSSTPPTQKRRCCDRRGSSNGHRATAPVGLC